MLENPLVWAMLLLILGLALIVLEMFIPSGGLLGVLAAAAVVGSMFVAVKYSPSTAVGASFVIGELIGVCVVIALALKYWPNTAIGRRIAPELPRPEDVLPSNEFQDLLGKIGHAKSPMLPSGAVQIDGRTVNAVSEGMAIDAGQLVKVIEVRGNRIVVRPCSDRPGSDRPGSPPLASTPRPPDDPLTRPLEELGLEDWKGNDPAEGGRGEGSR